MISLAAQTTIREVVGRYTFDEVLSEREKIGGAAREIIDAPLKKSTTQ